MEEMKPTLACSYEQFRVMASQFMRACPTASQESLDNGFKCLGLAYLGIEFDRTSLGQIHEKVSAPTVLQLAVKEMFLREIALQDEQSLRETEAIQANQYRPRPG